MAGLGRWAGFVVGLVVVGATFSSVVGTIVLPKGVRSLISYAVWRGTKQAFLAAAGRMRHYESKDRLLGLLGPVSLLTLLVAWLLLLLLGYALVFLPLTGDGFMAALRLAGSSLFTLGVASSPKGSATVVIFLAAATGLVVVALQIGYLPTIYGAYNRRETLVNMLESRAGEPAWGVELLAREQLIGSLDSLAPMFTDWERWAADLTESHVNYPWLLSFRSPYPKRSWVVSMLAVLDAAALYHALCPSRAPSAARHCLRTGFTGLRALAGVYRAQVPADPRPDDPIRLTFEEFSDGVDRLEAVGFPIERSKEEAWPHFRGWRVNYEAAAYLLADRLVAVPAPWSGERHSLLASDRLLRPVRPRHRSPDDPEGRTPMLPSGSAPLPGRPEPSRRSEAPR
ncbi:MAG TPA: hypothetical protein VGM21_19240 [Actinomycetota bacterium]|jgi:hypothetical protein